MNSLATHQLEIERNKFKFQSLSNMFVPTASDTSQVDDDFDVYST